jgi:hypothetical protein
MQRDELLMLIMSSLTINEDLVTRKRLKEVFENCTLRQLSMVNCSYEKTVLRAIPADNSILGLEIIDSQRTYAHNLEALDMSPIGRLDVLENLVVELPITDLRHISLTPTNNLTINAQYLMTILPVLTGSVLNLTLYFTNSVHSGILGELLQDYRLDSITIRYYPEHVWYGETPPDSNFTNAWKCSKFKDEWNECHPDRNIVHIIEH